LTKGESWFFTISVSDGDDSSIFYQSEPVLILNTEIVINSVDLAVNGEGTAAGDVYTDDSLILGFNTLLSYTDTDGDDIEDFIVFWYVNGLLRPDLTNHTVIPSYMLFKGDTWYCNVSVIDSGVIWSNYVCSRTITVKNSLPIINGVDLLFGGNEREFAINDEIITIIVDFSDLDNDSNQSLIFWYLQGSDDPISEYNNQLFLPSNATKPGDVWRVIIWPYDGEHQGDPFISINITIESRPIIVSSGFEPMGTTEGDYHIWSTVTDERNDIQQVEFVFTIDWLNWSTNYIVTNINGSSDTYVYDILLMEILDDIDFTELMNKNITVKIIATTDVTYSESHYYIITSTTLTFTIPCIPFKQHIRWNDGVIG